MLAVLLGVGLVATTFHLGGSGGQTAAPATQSSSALLRSSEPEPVDLSSMLEHQLEKAKLEKSLDMDDLIIELGDHSVKVGTASEMKREEEIEKERKDPLYNVYKPDVLTTPACGETQQMAGYIPIRHSEDKNYFYWMAESRSDPATDPLVLWLTGGPGCSSLLAMFAENGPCNLQADGTMKESPYGWNQKANVVWLDQPTNVGFSYGSENDEERTEAEVAESIHSFLQEFMKRNPKYQHAPLFIFGESYGGHYVPSAAFRVFQGMKDPKKYLEDGDVRLHLKGFGIGNGMTNPIVQMQFVHKIATDNAYNLTLVTDEEFEQMDKETTACVGEIGRCQVDNSKCSEAYAFCLGKLYVPLMMKGVNPYDMRKKCDLQARGGTPTKCYDFSALPKYLNSNATRELIHWRPQSGDWASCNMEVTMAFMPDWMVSCQQSIPTMLAHGIRAIIYAGDADLMVNWLGDQAWTEALFWHGKTAFNQKSHVPYMVNGEHKGNVKTHENFSFLRFFDAGHMVPLDQPVAAVEMLNAFLADKDLSKLD